MLRLIAVIAFVWASAAQAQEMSDGRLTVTGEGRVDSAPDMATMTLGVTAEAKTAGEALAQTSTATAQVLSRLTDAGIAARDMQTRDLSLSPIWDNRSSSSGTGPEIRGYQASNSVIVRIRALDSLGSILDDVVSNGANNFNGLTFGLRNPVPALDEARRAAVADAMRKAALFADAAGLALAEVLELREAGHGAPQPEMMGRMAMMSDAVPIAQGEVAIRAQVTMVFALQK